MYDKRVGVRQMKTKTLTLDIETTNLNPWFDAKVTTICAKTSTGQEFKEVNRDEKDLLSNFDDWLEEFVKRDFLVVTKNGKMFDLPFLLARMNLNELEFGCFYRLLTMKQFDLQEVTKRRVSLQDMATLLGFESKKGTGLDAIKWYKNGSHKKLLNYCWHDVLLTEQIYKVFEARNK